MFFFLLIKAYEKKNSRSQKDLSHIITSIIILYIKYPQLKSLIQVNIYIYIYIYCNYILYILILFIN
jgi:hypothetical protein